MDTKRIKGLAVSLATLLFIAFACKKEDSLSVGMKQEVEAQGASNRKSRHLIDSVELRSYAASDYYWFFDKKIPIVKQEGREVIVFAEENRSLVSRSYQTIENGKRSFGIPLNYPSQDTRSLAASSPNRLFWEVVKTSNSSPLSIGDEAPIYSKGFSYLTEDGEQLISLDVIVLELDDEASLDYLKEDARHYDLEILEKNPLSPLTYRVSCRKSTVGGAVEVANLLYRLGGYRYVQPDFLVTIAPVDSPNDPLYPSQWWLKDQTYSEGYDINIESGWGISKGSESIRIAVIDDGVDLKHPDINIYGKSYDAMNNRSPSELYGNHGTRCAGIVTGKGNNGIGISGVAPYCKVIPVSITYGSADFISSAARGFDFARKEAAVISNSWSCSPGHAVLQRAIEKALTEGRGGKGCVIVASAGNDGRDRVVYPASSHPDVIAVGAMSMCGEKKTRESCDNENWWASNYGDGLDIVAPGVKIATTDVDQGYKMDFRGTSSACPQVSGVAALILSVNPNLTQKEVGAIISRSAKKLPKYKNLQNKEYGKWNPDVGYGLLDAYQSLLLASSGSRITYFNDKVVDIFTRVSGFQIYSKNVQLRRGELTFEAQDMITIHPPFSVDKGIAFTLVHI